MLSIVALTVHESLEVVEIAYCIPCCIFGEYLLVTDVSDVHSKYYYHLTPKSIQHCHRTRFLFEATSFSHLVTLWLAVETEHYAPGGFFLLTQVSQIAFRVRWFPVN